MTSGVRHRSLVVVELAGGNDALNTVIPYDDGLYYDNRTAVRIDPGQVVRLDGQLGLNPSMRPIKSLWDDGKMAVINGIGYPNPNRSHFRSMDIWHTAEPDRIATEGWLGRAIRTLDPNGDNVLTGVNFGRGLPRALHCRGVPVASVGNLETYGLFPQVGEQIYRKQMLDAFARMYGGAQGGDVVMEFLGQTGSDALKGADDLKTAPAKYSSSVEYAANPLAQNLKAIAQVMFADLGTRIFYTQYGSFDTHASELDAHSRLWQDVSTGVADFMDDAAEHGRGDDFVMLLYSEFGRRIRDNGSGTDHGSGGVAFLIGDSVAGGMHGEYPSLAEADQLNGDLRFNNDFRSTYSTILDQWLGLEPTAIVKGQFEQMALLNV